MEKYKVIDETSVEIRQIEECYAVLFNELYLSFAESADVDKADLSFAYVTEKGFALLEGSSSSEFQIPRPLLISGGVAGVYSGSLVKTLFGA